MNISTMEKNMKLNEVDLNVINIPCYADYQTPNDLRDLTETEAENLKRARKLEEVLSGPMNEGMIKDDKSTPIAVRILLSRLKMARPEITLACFMFATLDAKNAGDAVMWAWSLVHMARRNQRLLTLDDMMTMMGDRLPTDDFKERLWDAQKKRFFDIDYTPPESDNMLDIIELWSMQVDPERNGWGDSPADKDDESYRDDRHRILTRIMDEIVLKEMGDGTFEGKKAIERVAVITESLAAAAASLIESTAQALEISGVGNQRDHLAEIFKQQFDATMISLTLRDK
jgi:hypothetical protein